MSHLLPSLLETHKSPKNPQSNAGEFATMADFRVSHFLKKMIRKSLNVLPKICVVQFSYFGSLLFLQIWWTPSQSPRFGGNI